jgi:hypothetical protein
LLDKNNSEISKFGNEGKNYQKETDCYLLRNVKNKIDEYKKKIKLTKVSKNNNEIQRIMKLF